MNYVFQKQLRRKDRFENTIYKVTNTLTVTNLHASPSACPDKADFYVRISNPLDVYIRGGWRDTVQKGCGNRNDVNDTLPMEILSRDSKIAARNALYLH